MKYKKLVKVITDYIQCENSSDNAQIFCEEYMEIFYHIQNDLVEEISDDFFNIFDDINLICDSYEINSEIRKNDRYCIDEDELKNKIIRNYQIILNYLTAQ